MQDEASSSGTTPEAIKTGESAEDERRIATVLGPTPGQFGFVPSAELKKAAMLDGEVNGQDGEQTKEDKRKSKQRVKILYVHEVWNSNKWAWEESRADKPKGKKKQKAARYIFKCARRRGADSSTSDIVYIYGEHIRGVLKQLTHEDRGPSFLDGEALDMDDLKLVYHQRDKLVALHDKETCLAHPNHELIFELDAAIDLIDEKFSDVHDQLAALPSGERPYDLLWTLFPPRTLVTGEDALGQLVVYRVRETGYRCRNGVKWFEIEADYIDSNGSETGFVPADTLCLMHFKSSKPILELDHYPLHLHPHYEREREALLDRGEKVLRLRGRHIQEYRGHAIANGRTAKFNSHGRVVLDPATLEQTRPNNSFIPRIVQTITEELTEDQKLLLKPVLYGFSLGDKTWGAFAVSSLTDVVWDESIIDALVLPDVQKDFLRCLIESHLSSDFDDFVRDKGKGLVGLLSGPPGVGKTLTAEAIAEIAQRPLYMVSSGELGSAPESVQAALNRIMELAEAWGAVVLLDEADVFLAERDNTNLVRNAITSIFLRQLEYYRGILILTTNRHASFDRAFKSRIHFSLDYPDHTTDTRRVIWESFIARAAASNTVTIDISIDGLEELARLPLNGRQVKNLMNITQTVAVRKQTPVTIAGIRTALGFLHNLIEY